MRKACPIHVHKPENSRDKNYWPEHVTTETRRIVDSTSDGIAVKANNHPCVEVMRA